MEAPCGLDRYLLEVASELSQTVLPHVENPNAAVMLRLGVGLPEFSGMKRPIPDIVAGYGPDMRPFS